MTDALLEIRDLQITVDGRALVHGIRLEVAAGQCLALVGESGSGKSLTAQAILRLLPEPSTRLSGHIRYRGEDLLVASPSRLRALRGSRVAMVFQEPMNSLNPVQRIERQLAEPLRLHLGLKADEARARAIELLQQVGIHQPQDKLRAYPHQLSGGQRQRVMIAMALACGPDLLIADEPTTALDVTVQRQILELLRDLQRDTGMALLLISHDLNLVRGIASHVAVMRDGRIVEQGSATQVFSDPRHPYSRELLAAEPSTRPPSIDVRAAPLLEVSGLCVRYPLAGGLPWRRRHHLAVDHVDLRLAAGHTLGIVGESGSGKSTLGRAILRLIGSEGRIRFEGVELTGLEETALRPLRRHMQVVFQDPFGSLSPRMSVQQIIEEGLRVHARMDAASREAAVVRVLEEVGLDAATRHRFPHEFSGGQRQRIAIARALVLEPKLLILDEPTSALDRSVQKQVLDLLLRLQRTHGLAYLFISHDLAAVRALAHQVMVIKDGRVIEQGDAHQVLQAPVHPYTRELITASGLAEAHGNAEPRASVAVSG